MVRPTLDSLTDPLFETCNTILEDPITYTPDGGGALSIQACVNHEDKTEAFQGSQITDQDIFVEVMKSDVATVGYGDVIYLPKLSQNFSPRDWKNNASGRGWIIMCKRVRV